MNKKDLIDFILNKSNGRELCLDCSRYEESYSGYANARDWFMRYYDNEISLYEYLSRLNEETLHKIKESL